MPVNVVKSPEDEHKWEKAKALAKEQGHSDDYSYIMGIYKKMNPDHFKSAGLIGPAVIQPETTPLAEFFRSLMFNEQDLAPVPVTAGARKKAPPAPPSSAQVNYAMHLLQQAARLGVMPIESIPAENVIRQMTGAEVSEMIEDLRKKRGKPEFYGNGKFKGWKHTKNAGVPQIIPLKALQGILAQLRALNWLHWTCHWQVSGDASYSDHLLFERLYNATIEEIDILAEKMVAKFGPESVNAPESVAQTQDFLVEWEKEPDLYKRAYHAEMFFQETFREEYPELKASGHMTLGLDDFLMSMANAHETACYLLSQRLDLQAKQAKQDGSIQTWTAYLYSKEGETLWQHSFGASSPEEADKKAAKYVQHALASYGDRADDWIVEKTRDKIGVTLEGHPTWTVRLTTPEGKTVFERSFPATNSAEAHVTGQGMVAPTLAQYPGSSMSLEQSGSKTASLRGDKLQRLRERKGVDAAGNLTRLAALVEVPHSFHPVKVEPPKAKRKEYPFEGYIDFQGIEIDVENKAGSTRKGVGPDGTPWSSYMHNHYGEIRGTEGADGDKLDVYVGPNHDSSLVTVIHQCDPDTGKFDEDKVMLGFDSPEEAIGAYKKQYDRPGFYREGECLSMPIGAFWRWVNDERNKGKKVSASARVASRYIAKTAGWGAEQSASERVAAAFLARG